jgi:hypothetical protein
MIGIGPAVPDRFEDHSPSLRTAPDGIVEASGLESRPEKRRRWAAPTGSGPDRCECGGYLLHM